MTYVCLTVSLSLFLYLSLSWCHQQSGNKTRCQARRRACVSVYMYIYTSMSLHDTRQAARLVNQRDGPFGASTATATATAFGMHSGLFVVRGAASCCFCIANELSQSGPRSEWASESGPMTHGQRVYWTSSSGNLNSYVSRQGWGRGGGGTGTDLFGTATGTGNGNGNGCVCMYRTRSQVSKVAKWSVLLPFAAFT